MGTFVREVAGEAAVSSSSCCGAAVGLAVGAPVVPRAPAVVVELGVAGSVALDSPCAPVQLGVIAEAEAVAVIEAAARDAERPAALAHVAEPGPWSGRWRWGVWAEKRVERVEGGNRYGGGRGCLGGGGWGGGEGGTLNW